MAASSVGPIAPLSGLPASFPRTPSRSSDNAPDLRNGALVLAELARGGRPPGRPGRAPRSSSRSPTPGSGCRAQPRSGSLGHPATSSSPPGASQVARQPPSRSSNRPAGVRSARRPRPEGAGPQIMSTRPTSVRGECAGRRYQSGDGVSLFSGRPRGPISAVFGRPGGPMPERFVRPAASSWIGATATPRRPCRSSVNTSSAGPRWPASRSVNPRASASPGCPSACAALAAASVAGVVGHEDPQRGHRRHLLGERSREQVGDHSDAESGIVGAVQRRACGGGRPARRLDDVVDEEARDRGALRLGRDDALVRDDHAAGGAGEQPVGDQVSVDVDVPVRVDPGNVQHRDVRLERARRRGRRRPYAGRPSPSATD